MTKHMALKKKKKRTLGWRGHEGQSVGTTLRLTETQNPGGLEADHVKDFFYFTYLTKGRKEGMNNIIKRRQD